MIRRLEKKDIDVVIQIWFEANKRAHDFIPESYWLGKFNEVKDILPQAEVYVYEIDNEIKGFIGLMDNYIAGIFIASECQSKGIGKELLCYAKEKKKNLSLSVYIKNSRAINFYKRENFKVISENLDENTGEKEFFMTWENK
ncbi:GNAT family N-acetyltransferase (plasmid) [Cetobacterium somerae]|uniref:GNAT family N-acetyltransferase n=1 Tax=Cetobacterium somerae TaxID=188913 RepID=UPI002E7C3335|nr:GNAT family N-acetyltransferase [Cetobacterium somerae]WVJ02841.1 GNAT family N-acetyltransferase [Cetobacterium somerae]